MTEWGVPAPHYPLTNKICNLAALRSRFCILSPEGRGEGNAGSTAPEPRIYSVMCAGEGDFPESAGPLTNKICDLACG